MPENRRDQGLCLNLSINLNINLPVYRRISRLGIVDWRAERINSEEQIRRLGIRTSSRSADVYTLSGGNQQKVVIGKWLTHGADLYLADEPTAGVDIGSKHDTYKLFADLLKHGAGLILISSYLPEVYDLADTLHVFRKGRLVASYEHGTTSHETILADAIGE
jgi:ribose transport system ATP-binding protein